MLAPPGAELGVTGRAPPDRGDDITNEEPPARPSAARVDRGHARTELVFTEEHAESRLGDRVHDHAPAAAGEPLGPRIHIASVDVAPFKIAERAPARRARHGVPEVVVREATPALVGALVELAHHVIERGRVVRRVPDQNVEREAGERSLVVIQVAGPVAHAEPGLQRGVFERRRRAGLDTLDLRERVREELRLVDRAAADEREVRVVVGHALAHPEPGRRLRSVVAIGEEVGRPESLHVPGVRELVGVDAQDEGFIKEWLADDRQLAFGVLERGHPTELR